MCASSPGRTSVGVRGIRLLDDDQVISMSILRHEEVAPDMRYAYLSLPRSAGAERRRERGRGRAAAEAEEARARTADEQRSRRSDSPISAQREEFVLSITEKGFGVRSSAYDYRITGRGGQGIDNMELARSGDAMVAVFPVGHNDQIMLVTDGGMVIRCPVDDIRIARRRQPGRGGLQGRRRRARRLGGAAARRAEENGDVGRRRRPPTIRRKPTRARHERAARRDLSRHLRPDHQRPYRHHPARDQDRRPAGHRRRPQ